jgi:hypothetical protein
MALGRRLSSMILFSTLAAGCARDAAPSGTVVVGVTSDFAVGDEIDRLDVTARVGGALREETRGASGADEELAFPAEIRLDGLSGDTPIDASFKAFSGPSSFLSRLASTRAVAGETRLLRVRLERGCIPSYRLPGGGLAPVCSAPETCIGGACVSTTVDPGGLPDFTSNEEANNGGRSGAGGSRS